MLKDFMESQGLTRLFQTSTSFKIDKKKRPPPVLHTGSGQAKQTPLKLMFQPSLNIISHWGWLCHTHFPPKGQVI